jgi:hypothetical protein
MPDLYKDLRNDPNGTNLSSFNDVFDFGFTFVSTRFWNDVFRSIRGQSKEWFRSFLSALGSLRPARKGTFSLAMTDSILSIIRP